MKAFVSPYSRQFTERLARVAAKRELEAKEKEKDRALQRHYGAPLVFELWRSTSHSTDITSGSNLLPGHQVGKKSAPNTSSAESPQSLVRAMTASLVGEGTVKQPVWRATASSELRARRAASPPPRYWLPSGKSGTTSSHTDEIGDVCSRSPHRRNNRTGRRRLAVERRFKRTERRQSSCVGVGAEPSAPSTPNTSFSTDRRASLPSTPGGGKHLVITVKIASASCSDERHAILSVSSACSRRELFRCIASQLQLQLVATRASAANKNSGSGNGDGAPQSLVADIILYADGYGAEKSCSLATHTLLDPPFCTKRGFDTCSRMRIVLKATAQQQEQQQQQQINEKVVVASEPPPPPTLKSPGSGSKNPKKPSPNRSSPSATRTRRPNPFDNPFDEF